ncbi:MAG TPA: carbohydrate binding domain-containing protein [Polyangiaceae bacterium]|nr:carbohydrate binding domain-containing protein [Polyangiaceae bacterium]
MLKHSPLSLSALLLAALAAGCIDASTKPCVDAGAANAAAAPPGAANGTTAAAPAAAGAIKSCAGAVPAADGLIDDLEDGNQQTFNVLGRGGYWWLHHDPNGSTLLPEKFAPEDGGPGTSKKTLHVHGVTSSENGAYGSSVGLNIAEKGLYDGSQYVGLAFKAKVGPNSTKNVRLKIGDVNTHGQLGTCASCWNHFGKDMQFTTEWAEYKVTFAELKQAEGWGAPRPASITPNQLASIDWTVGPGQTFDLWIDDVTFLGCP